MDDQLQPAAPLAGAVMAFFKPLVKFTKAVLAAVRTLRPTLLSRHLAYGCRIGVLMLLYS
jgi:hypothetical protein